MTDVKSTEAEISCFEEAHDVRVLLAVEAGSRAWGTSSIDSDYDARLVYVRRPEDYLSLEKLNGTRKDTIDWKLEGDLDICGWDLTKFLFLLRKSNTSAFEWMGSPVIYREDPAFASVRRLGASCYSQVACASHYLSTADHNLQPLAKAGPVQLKTYLNLVHAILAARWSCEHSSPAPVLFSELIEAGLEPEMRDAVESAILRKVHRNAKDQPERIPEIDEWALAAREEVAARVKEVPATEAPGWDEFDQVFRDIVLKRC